MGRVWREGQTKEVFIYRFATHGTLEENILQRQARKQGLATAMIDNVQVGDVRSEDWEDLRLVYTLQGYTSHGHPLDADEPCACAVSAFISAAAGLDCPAVRVALHRVRLLSATPCS